QPLPPDAPPPDAPPDAPPAPGGLVAWYPMEAVGPPIDCMADATARGHDGQCLINVPTSILGMHGNAYHFDRTAQIHVRDSPELDPPELTVAFWARLDAATGGGCA